MVDCLCLCFFLWFNEIASIHDQQKNTLVVKCWWNKPNWCIFRNPISGCDIWQHPLMIISIPIFTSFHICFYSNYRHPPIRWPIRQPCHGAMVIPTVTMDDLLFIHGCSGLIQPALGRAWDIQKGISWENKWLWWNIAGWWWYTYLPLWKMMEFVSD